MDTTDTDEELPPWLGERIRRTTNDIHRAAYEAEQDSKDTEQ